MNSIDKSVKELGKHRIFGKLIKKHGAPDLERGKNVFEALCRSIVYQQLSGKAAATIYGRFLKLFPGRGFSKSEVVKKVPFKKLRSVGLSNQKTSYILDLAEKFSDGTIKHKKLYRMGNEEVIAHLTEVKGIGVWTVHMFLIFTLNRPDILPTGDLGIKKGFQIVYRLKKLPEHEQMEKLAKPWRRHATAASWYFWRAADEAKGMVVKRGKN